MAFNLVTGVMGGGKSYMGTELCLQAAKEGAVVHTNLPLNLDYWAELGYDKQVVILPDDMAQWIRFEERDGKKIPVSDILIGGEEGRENIMVVDEASLLFDIDDQMKNRAANKPVFQLVALCRHAGLDLYFLAQHASNVDAKLRRMAETRTKCIKTERIPFVGWAAAPIFGTFRRIVFMGESTTPHAKTWHRFNPKVGKAYRTHGMKESLGMRIEATRKSKGADDSKKKGVSMAVMTLLFVVIAVGYCLYHFATYKQRLVDDATAKKQAAGIHADPVAAPNKGDNHNVVTAKPAAHRKGGWRAKEWEPEDELVLSGKTVQGNTVIIYARGGFRLCVGGSYCGEPVIEYVPFGGWHYFRTIFGRLIVVRPMYQDEREKLAPVTIAEAAKLRAQDQVDLVGPALDDVQNNIQRLTK